MYKIAVIDDDKDWCFVIKRFFSKDFEVYTFEKIPYFLQQLSAYDLVLVDYSIPPSGYDKNLQGCDIIHYLKANLLKPPLVVLVSGFISKNDSELGRKICPEADAFFAKDAGLEEILQQTKQLLTFKSSGN